MVHQYNMGRLKILLLLLGWTIGAFIFTGNAWQNTKHYLPTQWIPVHPSAPENGERDTTYDQEIIKMFKRWRESLDTSSGVMSSGKESFNSTEAPKSVVHFRESFDQRYASTVATGADNASDSVGYLIYRCDVRTMRGCGGWADRVKGMLAGYLIANLTGRIFKAEMLLPSCDIQQFVTPNLVNWSLPVSFHETVTIGTDVQIISYVDNVAFWKRVKYLDFSRIPQMKAKYLYYKSNLDYMTQLQSSARYKNQLSWMKGLTRAQVNAVVFKRLFKLSPDLHRKLNAFLENSLDPREQLLCAHVRIGRNPSLPFDSVDRVRLEDVPQIWNFFRNLTTEPSYKIFLMSDSDSVLSSAKNQSFKDKLIFTSGGIVHVERSRGLTDKQKCDGLEKVILEQFILMHCDVLLTSQSGLSRMSAYVRGSDEGLFCVVGNGQIVPCQGASIQELYGVMG